MGSHPSVNLTWVTETSWVFALIPKALENWDGHVLTFPFLSVLRTVDPSHPPGLGTDQPLTIKNI